MAKDSSRDGRVLTKCQVQNALRGGARARICSCGKTLAPNTIRSAKARSVLQEEIGSILIRERNVCIAAQETGRGAGWSLRQTRVVTVLCGEAACECCTFGGLWGRCDIGDSHSLSVERCSSSKISNEGP